jgi:hypothetical protein
VVTKPFKYQPLLDYLARATDTEVVALSLDQVESILGFSLPASARLSSWWANDPENGHYQATAWVNAGFRCRKTAGTVSFTRTTRG